MYEQCAGRRWRPSFVAAAAVAATVAAFACTTTGCGGADDSDGFSRQASATRESEGLRFTVSLPKSRFRRGERIPLTFRITNEGPYTYSVYNPGGSPAAVVGIRLKRGDETVVWPSEVIVAGGVVHPLAPGATIGTAPDAEVPCSRDANGLPDADRGCQAPPGTYRVETFFQGGISRTAEDGKNVLVRDNTAPAVEFTLVE